MDSIPNLRSSEPGKADRPAAHSLRLAFLGIFVTLGFVISLSEAYRFAGRFIEAPWAAAAGVNSLILIVIVLYFRCHLPKPIKPPVKWSLTPLAENLDKRPNLFFAPAFLVVIVTVLAATASRFFGTSESRDISGFQVAWITWIPVVEEVVFRVGLGNFLRRRLHFWLGTYFSILAFSVVHSLPTLDRVANLEISAPLGPMVLAVFCELIYVYSGKINPAIALHSACNATVVIFSLLDARWLDWLGLLYI
jgi:membrane protease YdiL (CAAX protease family)